ncbi:hypothetical protein [Acrocarpospora phusangensis]|nr:hypothetical protein [Acrocarpospora phusangensis]
MEAGDRLPQHRSRAYGTWHTRGSGYTPQPGDAVVLIGDWNVA